MAEKEGKRDVRFALMCRLRGDSIKKEILESGKDMRSSQKGGIGGTMIRFLHLYAKKTKHLSDTV